MNVEAKGDEGVPEFTDPVHGTQQPSEEDLDHVLAEGTDIGNDADMTSARREMSFRSHPHTFLDHLAIFLEGNAWREERSLYGWPVLNPSAEAPVRLPQLVAAPLWLPGAVEIEVAGEYYRQDSVQAAEEHASDGLRVAILVPEPPHSEHPNAVAVYVQSHLVGYLPSEMGHRLHPAILHLAAAQGGRLPSCPAEFYENSAGLQVVLLLNVQALGLPEELFVHVPEMAKTAMGLLHLLDQPVPSFRGQNDSARRALASAEAAYAEAAELPSYERAPDAWPKLEHTVGRVVAKLTKSGDPLVGRAWLILARSTRFQKGKRDSTVTSYVNALHFDRGSAEAWSELFEYLSAAPHVPMLLQFYARVPFQIRPEVINFLLTVSYGSDRRGNLSTRGGARLRAGLEQLAQAQRDSMTTAALAADKGRRAEKDNDMDTAIAAYRQAVAAGSTDPAVADRLSIWLVKQSLYAEAATVIAQALRHPVQSKSTRDRLQKRLERCQRALAPGS